VSLESSLDRELRNQKHPQDVDVDDAQESLDLFNHDEKMKMTIDLLLTMMLMIRGALQPNEPGLLELKGGGYLKVQQLNNDRKDRLDRSFLKRRGFIPHARKVD